MPYSAFTKRRLQRERHEKQLRERLRALQDSDDTDLGSDEDMERLILLKKKQKHYRHMQRIAREQEQAILQKATEGRRRQAAQQQQDNVAQLVSDVELLSNDDQAAVPLDSGREGDPHRAGLVLSSDDDGSAEPQAAQAALRPLASGQDNAPCRRDSEDGDSDAAGVLVESEDGGRAEPVASIRTAAAADSDHDLVCASEDGDHAATVLLDSDYGTETVASIPTAAPVADYDRASEDGNPAMAGVILSADEDGEIPAAGQPAPAVADQVYDDDDEDRVLCASDDEGILVESDHEADEADARLAREVLLVDDHGAEEQDQQSSRGERPSDGGAPVFFGPEDLSISKQIILFGKELVAACSQHDVSQAAADHITCVYNDNWPMLTRFVAETGRRIPNFISLRATCIRKYVPPVEISAAHRRMDQPTADVVVEEVTGLPTYPKTFSDRSKFKRLWMECKVKVCICVILVLLS